MAFCPASLSLNDVLEVPGVGKIVWHYLIPDGILQESPTQQEWGHVLSSNLCHGSFCRCKEYAFFKTLCLVSRTWRKMALFHFEIVQHEGATSLWRPSRTSDFLTHSVTLTPAHVFKTTSCFHNHCVDIAMSRCMSYGRYQIASQGQAGGETSSDRLPRTLRDALQSKWADVVALAEALNGSGGSRPHVEASTPLPAHPSGSSSSSSPAVPSSITVSNDLVDTDEVREVCAVRKKSKDGPGAVLSVYWTDMGRGVWTDMGGNTISELDRKLLSTENGGSRCVRRSRLAGSDRCAEFFAKLAGMLDFKRPDWNEFDPPIGAKTSLAGAVDGVDVGAPGQETDKSSGKGDSEEGALI